MAFLASLKFNGTGIFQLEFKRVLMGIVIEEHHAIAFIKEQGHSKSSGMSRNFCVNIFIHFHTIPSFRTRDRVLYVNGKSVHFIVKEEKTKRRRQS